MLVRITIGKKDLDELYQKTVDGLANSYISKSVAGLLALEHCVIQEISGIEVAIWHWQIEENESHIVVQASRRVYCFFYRNYLSGLVIMNKSSVRSMSAKEVGVYD